MEGLPKEPGLKFVLKTPSKGARQISGGRLFQGPLPRRPSFLLFLSRSPSALGISMALLTVYQYGFTHKPRTSWLPWHQAADPFSLVQNIVFSVSLNINSRYRRQSWKCVFQYGCNQGSLPQATQQLFPAPLILVMTELCTVWVRWSHMYRGEQSHKQEGQGPT